MSAQSYHPAFPPSQAGTAACPRFPGTHAAAPGPPALLRARWRARNRWSDVQRWFVTNTFSPPWLPPRWQHPALGYLIAVLLQLLFTGGNLLLLLRYPDLQTHHLPYVLGVVIMALSWGVGPSLVAMLTGVGLLYSVVLFTPSSWSAATETDAAELTLFLFICGAIISLSSQTQQARLHAEHTRREAERQHLLRERAEAEAEALVLREANQRMDSFLGIASHELKTPLTTIKLHLQLLQRQLRSVLAQRAIANERVVGTLEQLLAQCTRSQLQVDRLEQLVHDLLDISRIQAGRLELRPGPADLRAVVREAVDEQRSLAPQRTIQVRSFPEPAVPVQVDTFRIGQVVTNYLTNALKYSPEDQPVEVGIRVEGAEVRVWVTDAGPGIPPEEQAQIWERFHRVPGIEVQSGSGIGLGLGLHISRTIIEQHGGQVGVQSTPGQGATFWFTLPLVPPDEARRLVPTQAGGPGP